MKANSPLQPFNRSTGRRSTSAPAEAKETTIQPFNRSTVQPFNLSIVQNVNFSDLQEFFDFLPEQELTLVQFLREIVFRCIPDARENLRYNVPYYKRHRNICFIWPSSILWGKKKTYEGVRFGFTYGHLLTDVDLYLEKGSRKYVYWKDFIHISKADVAKLESLLFEAVLIDEDWADNRTG